MRRSTRSQSLIPFLTACFAAGGLLAGSPGARAQRVGAEFAVNEQTTGSQRNAEVAVDGAGNFIVVWQSELQDGSGNGIVGRRFDADAMPLGSEFVVNEYTTEDQEYPSVSADAAGNFVVVWQHEPSSGPSSTVARRFDAAGLPLGGDFQVNTVTADFHSRPDVAVGDDGFVVSWSSYDPDYLQVVSVFARRYDAAGFPQGEQFRVSSYVSSNTAHWEPDISLDPAGGFLVAWYGNGTPSPIEPLPAGPGGARESGISSEQEILAQRYGADGAPLGANFQVNAHTTDFQAAPSVARYDGSEFVVVWARWEGAGLDSYVLGRRFDGAGAPLSGEFPVSATSGVHAGPSMAPDGAGGFAVVWTEHEGGDGSESGLFGRLFDPAGDPVAGSFAVNSYTTGDQRSPKIASSQDGDFVVVWFSDGQDGDGDGVFGRRLRAGTVFSDGFESGDSTAWSKTVP